MVVSLVGVPVIISKLGLTGYGIWETILALSASTTLLLGPLTGTLLWRGSLAYGSRDAEAMRRTVGSGLLVTTVLLICASPVLWLARPLSRLVHVPANLVDQFLYALPAVILLTLSMGYVDSFAAVVDGAQRMAQSVIVRALGQAVRTGTAIIFLFRGYGLTSLIIGFTVSVVFMIIMMSILAFRLCPRIGLQHVLPSRKELVFSSRYAGLLAIGYVSAALRDPTDKLVFAFLASPVWVGFYAIASRLAILVMEINTFVYNATVAAAGAIFASGKSETLPALYSKLMSWVPMLAGAVLVAVMGLHREILFLWLGKTIPQVEPLLLMLLMANALVVALTSPGTAICRGIGRVEIETEYVVLNFTLNTLFTVILVKLIGPIGTVIASVGSWSLGAAYFAFILHRRLVLPVQSTLRAMGIYLGSVISGFLSMFAVNYIVGNPSSRQQSVFVLVVGGLFTLSFYFTLLYISNLTPDDVRTQVAELLSHWKAPTSDTPVVGFVSNAKPESHLVETTNSHWSSDPIDV